jgi:hypothetical protein
MEDKNVCFKMSKQALELVLLRMPHTKIFMAGVHFQIDMSFVIWKVLIQGKRGRKDE